MSPVFVGRSRHRPLTARGPITARKVLAGVTLLRAYDRRWLRPDVVAGVTVAAYMVPQVMAYAQIAGLPPAVGLYAVLAPAAVYLLTGPSRRLSVGPEATIALLSAGAIAAAPGGADAERRLALAAALAILVGAICVLGWFLGLGFLADLLSRPVLIGYLAGVAVLMVTSQITTLTLVPAEGENVPAQVVHAIGAAGQVHWPTLALSAGLVVVLFLGARLLPRLPMPLVTVLLGAALVTAFRLQEVGIRTVGDIPRSLPLPAIPHVTPADLLTMLGPAIGIAVVAYSDNVLCSRAFGEDGEEPADANQELLAIGAANVAAGVFQGLPVSASSSRTAIGVAMGSRTQVFSLVAAAGVMLSVLVLGPVLAAFPKAALGALVVYAAWHLVKVDEMRRIARFRRSEVVLMVSAAVGVVVFGALGGIGLAVALSLGDLLRRVARPHDGVLGYVAGLAGMHDVGDYAEARQVPGLVVYRYDSPLFFANAEDFHDRALQAVDTAEVPAEWLVLNMEANVEVDLTSMDALRDLVTELRRRRVVVALARVKHELREDLRRSGILDLIGEAFVFPTLPTAVTGYLDWHETRYGRPHPIRET